jgi:hypothetical protein
VLPALACDGWGGFLSVLLLIAALGNLGRFFHVLKQ